MQKGVTILGETMRNVFKIMSIFPRSVLTTEYMYSKMDLLYNYILYNYLFMLTTLLYLTLKKN